MANVLSRNHAILSGIAKPGVVNRTLHARFPARCVVLNRPVYSILHEPEENLKRNIHRAEWLSDSFDQKLHVKNQSI